MAILYTTDNRRQDTEGELDQHALSTLLGPDVQPIRLGSRVMAFDSELRGAYNLLATMIVRASRPNFDTGVFGPALLLDRDEVQALGWVVP